MKPASIRRFTLILSVALAGIFVVPEALAGRREVAAITSQLPLGTTIDTATDAELSNAVILAIGDPANRRLNPATIAGEALKGAITAMNIGDQLAQDIQANLANPNGTFPKINADIRKFAGTAARIAATGIGANPTQIPTFIAVFTANPPDPNFPNANAITIAKFAAQSPTAVGAILGGRALNPDIATDDDLISLANQAITERPLARSAQQISQYLSDSVVDAADFAFRVVGKDSNKRYIVQIATGTTASNPTRASAVVDAMFAGNAIESPVFGAAVKSAPRLAASVALVADAEDVQAVGVALAQRIGLVNGATGKVVGIAQSRINSIATGLVKGLALRATASGADNLLRNSRKNRIDEIGETTAYLFNAVSTLPVFANTGTRASLRQAVNIVTGLIKTAIRAAAKVHRDIALVPPQNARATSTKDGLFQATVADDVAGSVAQTLRSLGTNAFGAGVYDAIFAALTASNSGTKIAGRSRTTYDVGDGAKPLAQIVRDALIDGLDPMSATASIYYEDGTQPGLAYGPVGMINEPETDIRNR